MVAVDTNVLVRLLTNDDPEQAAIVRMLFDTGPVWIPKTVVLETAWVLNSLYDVEETAIAEGFRKLMGLPNVKVENENGIAAALSLTLDHGLELADALHLCSRPQGMPFVTFDRPFVKRAQRAGVSDISSLASKPGSGAQK